MSYHLFQNALSFKIERQSVFSCLYFCYSKTNFYICNALYLIQATKARQITLLRAFFMSEALPIILYSSVPCGVLMDPLPVSGGEQRGAELFLFPLRI